MYTPYVFGRGELKFRENSNFQNNLIHGTNKILILEYLDYLHKLHFIIWFPKLNNILG